MLSMSKWLDILKQDLKSKRTRTELREFIMKYCLVSQYMHYGKYIIDEDMVWKYLVAPDANCRRSLEKMGVKDLPELQAYYEQKFHHQMWLDYRLTYLVDRNP